MRTRLETTFCFLTMAAAGAAQQAVTLEPSKDASMFSNSGGVACGQGVLVTGRTTSNGVRRALVAFDVAGKVPAGSKITSVTLRMTVTKTTSGTQTTSLHRVTADWGEGKSTCFNGRGGTAQSGDATWTHRVFNTKTWAKAGGDFVASASASTSGSGLHTWASNASLVADVQSWLDKPAANFGWIVITNEAAKSARLWSSREGAATLRPKLAVQFTPPRATVVATGKGCQGPFGRDLRHVANGLPKLGNKGYSLDAANGPVAGAAVLLLTAGLQKPAIKLNANNCFLYVNVLALAATAGNAFTNGKAAFPLGIPNNVAFAGVKFDTQVLGFDLKLVLRTSNALTSTIGS